MTILHLTDLKMAVHFPILFFLSFMAISHQKYKYQCFQITSKNTTLQRQTVWVVPLFEFQSVCVCMCASVHLCARDITMSYYRLHKFLFSDQGNADEFLFYRTNWNDLRGITKLWTDNSSICSVEVPSTDSWPLSIWQVPQMSPPINTSIHQTYCVCRKVKYPDFFSVWSHVWTCLLLVF